MSTKSSDREERPLLNRYEEEKHFPVAAVRAQVEQRQTAVMRVQARGTGCPAFSSLFAWIKESWILSGKVYLEELETWTPAFQPEFLPCLQNYID